MYLSSNQHDQLQTIVTGFEIPFRTYIAIKLTDRYQRSQSAVIEGCV